MKLGCNIMEHIEVAISVIKDEIEKMKYDLKYGHNTPDMEEEITEKLQKLHRAIWDIKKQFGLY